MIATLGGTTKLTSVQGMSHIDRQVEEPIYVNQGMGKVSEVRIKIYPKIVWSLDLRAMCYQEVFARTIVNTVDMVSRSRSIR
jgi:hypothetical protein